MYKPIYACARTAVTLIEVVFSIGVILIGLVGLLSILPLAGRRAQDAISLSVGSAIAQNVSNELESRGLLSSGRLRPIALTTSTPVTNLTVFPTPAPFCIDPIFASSNTPPASIIPNGYTAALFPYFKVNHNPLADPSTNSTSWPVSQPRMVRVGIARQSNLLQLLSISEALAYAEDSDDLPVTRPDDRTLNSGFEQGEAPVVSGGLEYGEVIPNGDFTWIATVNPLPGGVYASVSVVVMRNRARDFETPTATTAPPTPQGNGTAERLAYVTFATGFSGGAGGVVHLVSAANTVSAVSPTDWVLLSRSVGTTPVHRWYRVVSASTAAETFVVNGSPTTDDTNLGARFPSSGNRVWRQKVMLDGPDWAFNFIESGTQRQYADSSLADNTYATIVEGVVSVTERTVLLEDL